MVWTWCKIVENRMPECVKRKLYGFLLDRYLGRYILKRIEQNQIEVSLDTGFLTLSNILLDVQALNELAENHNLPLRLLDGSLERVSIYVPLGSLSTESCVVEFTNFKLTVQPKQRFDSATSMLESMWTSVASTVQMAEQCMGGNPTEESYTGLLQFTSCIDDVIKKVKIVLNNTTIQMEYLPPDCITGLGILMNVDLITYNDEAANDPLKEETLNQTKDDEKKQFFEKSYTTKHMRFEGITLSTVEFSSKVATSKLTTNKSSMDDKEESFSTILENTHLDDNEEQPENLHDPYSPSDDRHIIPFGKYLGYVEMLLRAKQSGELEGPQVAIEMNMSHLLMFLTPRQVHHLTELITGLTITDPDEQRQIFVKPMSSSDYKHIEKDLERQMNSPHEEIPLRGLGTTKGWATGTIDDIESEEIFVPMKAPPSPLLESTLSLDSAAGSSLTSSITSSCTECSNRQKMGKVDADPTVEITRFEVHLAALSVVLLHEDMLTEYPDNCSLVPSTVNQMRRLVQKFFVDSASLYRAKDFREVNKILDKTCKASHLRLLACPLHIEGDQKTTSSDFAVSGYIETPKLELKECLYEDEVIKHVDLITFSEAKPSNRYKAQFTAKPSLKLMFKQKATKASKLGPTTDLNAFLDKCNIELDITIIDRITALFSKQRICRPYQSNNPWAYTVPVITGRESKVDLKINSPLATIKLRFPKPDFRPPHDINRTAWWKRNVHKDYLSLVFSNIMFQTTFQTNVETQNYVVNCKGINVFYHEDAISPALPIAKAGYEDKAFSSMQDVLAECKLDIKIFPPKTQSLDEDSTPNAMSTSLGPDDIFLNRDNGPFSSKTIIYESDTPHHKKQRADDKKEVHLTGDRAEISDFINTAIASARIQIDVTLPVVSVLLASKHLYEMIYNRVSNDLLLWEPCAPMPKTSSVPSYEDINSGPYGHVEVEKQEVFSLCKSGIQYDSGSDSEEEDSSNMYFSTYDAKMKFSHKPINKITKESYLTLNLQISKGLLVMSTPVREYATNHVIPGIQGEFFINVENVSVFMVNGYKGDPALGYISVEMNNGQLHHCDMIRTPNKSPSLKDIGAIPGKHLHPTIYKSESGILTGGKGKGGNREMLTLCVKIQGNHETHHVKNITIALGLNKATLRHRMCNEPNSWMSQLMDFFNVKDYPVPGYRAKEIITELYAHLWDSSIDYRPRYLPLRAILSLGTFSISSHLSAEANTSTLRFIAEECGLFLSQKGINKKRLPFVGPIDLKRDYINVIELGLFDISLKTTDKKNTEIPHIDLRASNDRIRIRTCADSARALTQLLNYIASDGDLVGPEDTVSSAFSSPRHLPEHELVSVEPQEIVNISASQKQQIHELLKDALDEDEQPPRTQKAEPTSELYSMNGAKLFYFPDEKQPSSVCDAFHTLPQVTSELGQVPFQPDVADIEEDFCFIDEEPGYDIFPKNGEPEIKWLTDDPVRIVENHFTVPSEKTDPLKTPKNFPTPTMKYTLCEMTVIWQMYGGSDFETPDEPKKKNVNFADTKLKDKVEYSQSEGVKFKQAKLNQTANFMTRGGPNRNHDILMELQLNKIKFQHEVYPDTSSKASRQIFIVSNFEIRDRLKCSQLNKFLYHYVSETRPKQSNAHMISIKAIHIRPDPQLSRQECCLKISLQPLRFNIDQDALLFLISFFKELGEDVRDDDVLPAINSKQNTPIHQPPIMTAGDDTLKAKVEAKKIVDENLLILLEENKVEEEPKEEPSTSTTTSIVEDTPIFFRRLIFAPDVPIKLDYHGKYIDISHGPIHGVLMGLAHLNCSELRLKRITHRHGILGFEKLLTFLVNEWLNDIKKNQLPSLLIGVGPLISIVQLFQGFRDLFCLPFEQYRRDGRFFRGLHRGAHSFTTCTFMAAIELTSRLIYVIQYTAETAFDMLTPGPSIKHHRITKKRKRTGQPKDIREGVTNALLLVKEGFEETADNILQVASHEHEQKGYSGAVGGVIRQIPPTMIKPIIIASEATNNVLGGMRSQLIPGARREAHEKWRSEEDSNL